MGDLNWRPSQPEPSHEPLPRATAPGSDVEAIAREKLAQWMIANSITTGHGDTFESLLGEVAAERSSLQARIGELERERDEAKAALTRWGDVGAYHSLRTANDRAEAAERHRDMLKYLLDEANASHFDATMRAEAAEASLASERAANARLREALEIIAGKRQCLDNLMSNVEVARAALSAPAQPVSNPHE